MTSPSELGTTGSRSGRQGRIRRASVETLEPRLLLSADLPGVAVGAGAVGTPDAVPTVETAEFATAASSETSQVSSPHTQTQTHAPARELQVVFIDGGLEGSEVLVQEMFSRLQEGDDLHVVVLDPMRDALGQIDEALAAYEHEVSAVHLIAHGGERGIPIRDGWIDAATLSAQADLVAGWSGALAPDADWLLYGCDLAASEQGLALVETLARLTGADVAASVDRTGSARLGGDWDLEYRTGSIEVDRIVGPETRWKGVLATVRDEFDSVAYDNDDGTDSWSGSWQELGESTNPSSGLVRVDSGALRIGASSESDITGRGLVREADLSGATSATLTYDFRREEGDAGAGSILVQISDDGGSTWTTLRTHDLDATDGGFTTESFDVSSHIASDTQLRFVGSGLVEENTFFFADNVQIEYSGLLNIAPILLPVGPSLPTIDEDATGNAGEVISALLGGAITDLDIGSVEGIAVTGLVSGNGAWEYSTDGGVSWTAVGAVSDASALLLRDTDRVRFVPDGENADAGSFSYRAWDRTTGSPGTKVDATITGGTTAFSAAMDTASITVTAVNDAPTLSPVGPSLPTIDEDATGNAGEVISALLGGAITDLDIGSVEGIAVTGLVSGNGAWEYSTDGGVSWTAVGAVSDASALLLRDTDRVRFVPDGENADAGSFSYRAWDRTTGSPGTKVDATITGGTTAFSAAMDTASITVTAVNDAPTLADATLAPVSGDDTDPAGETVASLFAGGFADLDAGASLTGVAVVGNAADASTEGVWQYSSDGGASWFDIAGVNDGAGALVLGSSAQLRFVPAEGFDGPPNVLVVRALDDTYPGGLSSTAGGVEMRVQVDTGSSGGSTSVAGIPSTVSVTVTPGASPPDPPIDLDGLLDPTPPLDEGPPSDDEVDGGGPDSESDPSPDASPTPAPTPPGPPLSAEVPEPPIRLGGTGLDRSEDAEPETTEAPIDSHAFSDVDPDSEDTTESARVDARAFLRRLAATSLDELLFLGRPGDFHGELDSLREDADERERLETQLIASTVAVTTGLSVGYVAWLTRGGLLAASLLSSMPAWRLVDPVPILARLRGEDDDEREERDEESLDSLVRGKNPPDDHGGGTAPADEKDGQV